MGAGQGGNCPLAPARSGLLPWLPALRGRGELPPSTRRRCGWEPGEGGRLGPGRSTYCEVSAGPAPAAVLRGVGAGLRRSRGRAEVGLGWSRGRGLGKGWSRGWSNTQLRKAPGNVVPQIPWCPTQVHTLHMSRDSPACRALLCSCPSHPPFVSVTRRTRQANLRPWCRRDPAVTRVNLTGGDVLNKTNATKTKKPCLHPCSCGEMT